VSQLSFPLQVFSSAQDVPTATGSCVTPVAGSQASAVHGLLSSMITAAPGAQMPPVQVSPFVQTLLSLHTIPSGASGFEQVPLIGSQTPTK
jgi:hypothetical protein